MQVYSANERYGRLVNSQEQKTWLLPRDGRQCLPIPLYERHRKPSRRLLRSCTLYKDRKLAYVSECQADISPGCLYRPQLQCYIIPFRISASRPSKQGDLLRNSKWLKYIHDQMYVDCTTATPSSRCARQRQTITGQCHVHLIGTSSVSTGARPLVWWPVNRGSTPGTGERFLSSLKRSGRLWSQRSLLPWQQSEGCSEAPPPPPVLPTSVEVKNMWSYTRCGNKETGFML